MIKRLLLIALLFIPVFVVKAQNREKIKKQFNEIAQAYDQQRYAAVINKGEPLASSLDTIGQAYTDSVFITTETLLSRSYYRLTQAAKAAEAVEKILERMKKLGMTGSDTFAFMLDNAGLYYLSSGDNEKALQYSLAAQDSLMKVPGMDIGKHMSAIQIRLAEEYSALGKKQDAVIQEIKALNMLDQIYGQHSQEYIDELPYLAKYFRDAGQEKKATETETKVDRLQKEFDDGVRDVPDPNDRDLKSVDECHKYRYEAYRCADYYLSLNLNEGDITQRQNCVQYLIDWSQNSNDIRIVFNEEGAKLLEDDKEMFYALAYVAGCVKYAIENNDTTFSYDMYSSAMVDALNYYVNNCELTGKVKYFDKYVAAYKKGEDNLVALLKKNYPVKK